LRRFFRVGGVVVVLGALLALAWSIISDTAGYGAAHTDPETALGWNGRDADALVALAETRLGASEGAPDTAAVRDLARAALHADPLNERALRALGLAADVDGAADRSYRLMQLSAERTHRDLGAQVWLFDERFKQGRADEAMDHADAILRLKPDMLDALMPAITAIASSDIDRAALISVLDKAPPWRGALLAALAKAASPMANSAIFAGLQTGDRPLTPVEMAPYIYRLIDEKQYELAFLTWLRSLSPSQSSGLPYAYNGDFDLPASGLPFDWAIAKAESATAEVTDSGDENRGPALHVVFSGARVAYRHVTKLLLLPPGSYRLSGLARADSLDNPRGLVWRIYCADAETQTLGVTPAISGNSEWSEFTADFRVPATGCRAQWMRLEIASTVAIEQEISGTVWYDHFAVTRTPDAPPS
jgi:hypothetical protein